MDDRAESMVAINDDILNTMSDSLESDTSHSHIPTSHTAIQDDIKPILSSLPVDVVSEIFLTACEDVEDSDAEPLDAFSHPNPPVQFLIGSVCKAWRELAWSTSRLWTRVRISLSPSRSLTQKQLLQDWIKRSQNCPLDLQIGTMLSRSEAGWEPPVNYFLAIAKSCRRWERLHSQPFTGLSVALSQMTRPRFPLLKDLHLDFRGMRIPSDDLQWNFEDAINLKNLQANLGAPKNLSVNWASLVHLQTVVRFGSAQPIGVFGLMWNQFRMPLSSLSSCLSLRSLDCKLIGSPPAEDLQRTIFQHLEDLKITSDDFSCARFLSYITTPSLKKAEFTLSYANILQNGVETWTSAFLNLSERSSFNLSEIYIQSVGRQNSYNDEFVDMLRRLAFTNSIERLTLLSGLPDRSPLSGRMMELLTVDPNLSQEEQKEHFPYLQEFWYSGFISFPIKLVIAMIESRLKHQEKGGCKRAVSLSGAHGNTFLPALRDILDALPPFHFDVTYRNHKWIKDQDPHDVQCLNELLEKISSGERKCKIAPLEERLMRAYGIKDD